jgi:hypothetical protein
MRHAQRHLAWEQTAIRQIAERRAEGSGRVQEASGRMLTAATVYEVVQQRGFDQVLSGEVNPTVKDMLLATAALAEIERRDQGISTGMRWCLRLVPCGDNLQSPDVVGHDSVVNLGCGGRSFLQVHVRLEKLWDLDAQRYSTGLPATAR